jgi:hypothetical protein
MTDEVVFSDGLVSEFGMEAAVPSIAGGAVELE